MNGRCIHCGGRVQPPDQVCESCLELIADIGADDYVEPPPPRPAPQPAPDRPYQPTQADIQAFSELSERGSFRPLTETLPRAKPYHARGRWGRAIEAEKRRPEPPK